jgi:protein-S-isoprenylcysteine O-methyltransferase Ste14
MRIADREMPPQHSKSEIYKIQGSSLAVTETVSGMSVALRTLLFTVLVPGGLAVAVPYVLLRSEGGASPVRNLSLLLIAVTMIVLGAGIYLACAWDFTIIGKGTPAVWDPPKVFVSKGLYRYVRNPMYVGMVTLLTGESVLFRSMALLAVAAGAALIFHLFVVFYEEPKLRRTFGSSYEEYSSRVHRWRPRLPS